MKKFMLALLLSAVLISTHHQDKTFNNSGQKVAITKPAGQAEHSEAAPAQVVKPVSKLAAHTPQVQTVAQGCDAYRSLIDQYNWNTNVAFAVMRAENPGCNPASTSKPNWNGSVDRGLFQVNSIHADMVNGNLAALYNPTTNVATAYRIYSGGGWKRWSTFNSGKYLSYLE